MKPTDILKKEHDLIRQALEIMGTAVDKMEHDEKPPVEFFEKTIAFCRLFVDEFHHFKEEHLMFGKLAQIEQGAIDPQIELLRNQHERGREHVNLIFNALEGYRSGDDEKALTIMENMAAFISLLKLHIHQEDHHFFPMCDKEFSSGDMEYLAGLFKKEEEKYGADTFANNEKIVSEMKALIG